MSSVPPPPQLQPTGPPSPEPDAAPAQDVVARPVGRAGWHPALAVAAFVVGYAGSIMVGGLVIAAATPFGSSFSEPPPGINLTLVFVQNAVLFAAAFAFARLSGRPAAADFGLRSTRLWRSAGLLVAVWVAFFLVSAAWALLVDVDDRQTLPEELGADGPLLNVLGVVVVITVVAPLGEELFFRGFFFGALRNWRGPWLAAVLTGAAFGLVHAGGSPVVFLLPLALFGVGLCLLYEWTGSLYPPIALHALNNSVALGANLDWTWQIPLMMATAPLAALGCAWLLGRAIGDGGRAQPAVAPASGA